MKILLFLSLLFGVFTANTKIDSYSLTIKTNGLENSKGSVIVALYNREGSIPDQKLKKYYRKVNVPIINKKAEAIFNNLPKGLYAVTLIHDENKNEKLDTKFLLPLPKEGIGFSNYEDFGLSNRPSFNKASFNLIKDTIITIQVIYK
ncbi:DUF2141 domain-containing protein [Polaribacter sp. IC073]|uniref:DUF2141 domain-containing protein n=1 Tax=Polaribacter sp. IC073 TaxID=2508540 RepID=UPI0011BE1268|nr:DUF2141 domain-containing protein [Polaribacter sp. IC073]TXD49262.1 DUF2141 domain-containing protein [Polaribacter sp. IC073]